jgi:hypothetical protein
MKRGRVLVLVVAVLIFVGYLVYGSMRVVRAECELCVEFGGRTECRVGSGETEEDARRAAQRAACAVMAVGMNESIACGNRVPHNVRCSR